jgi:sugar lactone lactonase YvrE
MVCNSTPLKAHVLRDYRLSGWSGEIEGRWHYRDLVADESWRNGWISFDSVTWNPEDRALYCGLNSLDGDLLYRFDPRSNSFTCLHTKQWADAFDSKIHRNLLYNSGDGCLYFATSSLHDVDQQRDAPGGKIVRYDPRAAGYEVLGIPAAMLYIQSLAADFRRGLLYGFLYPAEAFFMFDLASRRTEILAYTGNSMFFSQPHNPAVDGEGWVWGTCAETRAWDETLSVQPIRLFKFHPEGKRFVWFRNGLPRREDPDQLVADPEKPPAGACLDKTRHQADYGFCDSMLFDGSRYIYAGTVAGVLCRIDTFTDRVEKVAHVMAAGRFPALAMDARGALYGGGGMQGHTQIMRWDPRASSIDSFYNLHDPERDDGPARIHEMAIDESGCLYLGENDNHCRSSYLWTARLPEPAGS